MRRILSFRDFDWTLLAQVLLLCTISVFEIYSATLHTKYVGFHTKQLFYIACGLVAMFLFAKIDYHRLLDWAPWAYGVCLVALVAVRIRRAQGPGRAALDQRRPHALSALGVGQADTDPRHGPLLCQPGRPQRSPGATSSRPLSWWASPCCWCSPARPGNDPHLHAHPDRRTLSSAASISASRSSSSPLPPFLLFGAWTSGKVLKPYQKARLTSFVNPDNDPRGAGYQLLPVAYCRRRRRRLGPGRRQRHPDPGRLPPHPPRRLHLCRLQRGTRLRGRDFRPAAILLHIDAFDSERSNGRGPVRFPDYHGNCGCVDLSDRWSTSAWSSALCQSPEFLYR